MKRAPTERYNPLQEWINKQLTEAQSSNYGKVELTAEEARSCFEFYQKAEAKIEICDYCKKAVLGPAFRVEEQLYCCRDGGEHAQKVTISEDKYDEFFRWLHTFALSSHGKYLYLNLRDDIDYLRWVRPAVKEKELEALLTRLLDVKVFEKTLEEAALEEKAGRKSAKGVDSQAHLVFKFCTKFLQDSAWSRDEPCDLYDWQKVMQPEKCDLDGLSANIGKFERDDLALKKSPATRVFGLNSPRFITCLVEGIETARDLGKKRDFGLTQPLPIAGVNPCVFDGQVL